MREYRITDKIVGDLFGTVPLYYTIQDDTVYCSDRIADLVRYLKDRRINMEALHELLERGYVVGPKTMFQGMYRIPPAYQLRNGKLELYYDIFQHKELPAELLETLKECVAESLPDEKVVGAFLSGGLDTSTVVALAVEHRRIETFSLGFDHPTDEIAEAEIMAKKFNVNHHVRIVSFDDIVKRHDEIIQNLGRPAANYWPYFVSEMASKYVRIMLSGEGSDEFFGGYPTTTRFQEVRHDPALVDELIKDEVKTKLPYEFLEVDYACDKAFGIETRTPFLNAKLLGYLNMPWQEKMTFDDGGLGKVPLRKALKAILPDEILQKPKHGFTFPYEPHGQQLAELADEALKDPRMQKIIPEKQRPSKMIPQSDTLYNVGRRLLRSHKRSPLLQKLGMKEKIMVQHPLHNLLLYSIRRWIEIFDVGV